MKRHDFAAVFLVLAILCLWTVSGPGIAQAAQDKSPLPEATYGGNPSTDYIIGSGDILEISVWKEPDLAKLVTVLPDGKITFPLIGQIVAEGATLEQLKTQIEKKILRFVPNPNLTVAVHEIKSLYVYIVGKVHKAGRFELNTNIDVLQALALAGGLNPFAKKSKIKIFRKSEGRTLLFEFDYDRVSEGNNLEQNITLQRGDVIVVP
jgi:polysaccharide export outer membrane protein